MQADDQQLAADTALLQLGRRLQADGYHFTTVTPLTHRRVNERAASKTATTLRDVFGWSRLFTPSLMSADELEQMRQAGVIEERPKGMLSKVRWSTLGDLLLVHSGFPTTANDAVFFGPDTYRFAQVIEAHLQSSFHDINHVIDIGCGSGAGAILVAKARREAQVLATDINPMALRMTSVNAALAGVSNVSCQHSDVLRDVIGTFDLIVANPPYMKDPGQRAYRHGGGDLGAELSRRIVEEALPRLSVGGSLLLYTGVAMVDGNDPFIAALKDQLDQPDYTWTYRELDPDVFGEELATQGYESVDRIAAVALTVTRQG
ncbi:MULTISPECIES: class I SAM-dependent methyltransferase [unclassified Pseudomonas]|uniref:class I SAM-dependent methyltransferase n=1 Tax=unclassified Pseudomonas TaxID=196821 RepID=UPI002AC8C0D9|nr:MULTISPECIES: class I SAM-dependent methyltransferase [unclassified Pseudomonas]MEB0039997.1 class I SAM-dependent methyltransferase [Pseudomonas sp. MH10]MEB0119522.1 class I SAM-dependent methyltransferase [Pseudomonas sp. CCI1.2]WPX65131.1 class I SAM-dependent methyltransferase [Pseudomonas sp. MH10]